MSKVCPVCQSPITPGASVCASCGFRLSGATQSFTPIVFDEAEKTVEDEGSGKILRMVRGPKKGMIYQLSDITTIGRNPQCDIFLNDMTVSRNHATIKKVKDAYIIHDEKSYNGLWVNNASVDDKVLDIGDFIQIGKYGFMFDNGD